MDLSTRQSRMKAWNVHVWLVTTRVDTCTWSLVLDPHIMLTINIVLVEHFESEPKRFRWCLSRSCWSVPWCCSAGQLRHMSGQVGLTALRRKTRVIYCSGGCRKRTRRRDTPSKDGDPCALKDVSPCTDSSTSCTCTSPGDFICYCLCLDKTYLACLTNCEPPGILSRTTVRGANLILHMQLWHSFSFLHRLPFTTCTR